jgi:hypothetical protein
LNIYEEIKETEDKLKKLNDRRIIHEDNLRVQILEQGINHLKESGVPYERCEKIMKPDNGNSLLFHAMKKVYGAQQ